jgi:hypothetical protein
MAVLEKHWATRDLHAVVDEKVSFSFTFTVVATGQPLDISGYTFYFAAGSDWTTDTITVADGAMTKSNSGLGITDTLTVPLSATDLGVDEGRYQYDLAADTGTQELVLVRGTLTVYTRESAVA